MSKALKVLYSFTWHMELQCNKNSCVLQKPQGNKWTKLCKLLPGPWNQLQHNENQAQPKLMILSQSRAYFNSSQLSLTTGCVTTAHQIKQGSACSICSGDSEKLDNANCCNGITLTSCEQSKNEKKKAKAKTLRYYHHHEVEEQSSNFYITLEQQKARSTYLQVSRTPRMQV